MINKLCYSFFKDLTIRMVSCTALIGVVLCVVLGQAVLWQCRVVKEVSQQEALIREIPSLRARISAFSVVGGLSLTGIISGKMTPMVVINSQLLKVGEEIEGRSIVAISDHEVTVCDIKLPDKCEKLVLSQ